VVADSPRILVIENDALIRALVEELLREAGYLVSTARHGADALEEIRQELPRLILLDMDLPVMDGWAFARAYEALPSPPAPIIVLATIDAAGKASQIGAVGYCAMPFDVDTLLALVQGQVVRSTGWSPDAASLPQDAGAVGAMSCRSISI
jgi:CheY-like chemotaxis protein